MKHYIDYTVVGDFEVCGEIHSCLIYVCGSKESAEENLNRMLNNPDENDLRTLNKPNFRGNLHIEVSHDGWWNYGTD